MMTRTISALAVVLSTCAIPAVASPIVYNNGAPDGGYWSVGQGYLLADDFMFPVDTLVTEILVDGDSWMILDDGPSDAVPSEPGEGGGRPNRLVAFGSLFDPIAVRITGGQQYWVGGYNSSGIDGGHPDPCSSAGASTTARNSTLPAYNLSDSHGGALLCPDQPGDPFLFEPTDFSAAFWGPGTGDEVDFAFELRGQTIPEPSVFLLLGTAGVMLYWKRVRSRVKR